MYCIFISECTEDTVGTKSKLGSSCTKYQTCTSGWTDYYWEEGECPMHKFYNPDTQECDDDLNNLKTCGKYL